MGADDELAFEDELRTATDEVGTRLLFENERVRVWEVSLEPGARAPFHAHRRPYFWSCVDAGSGFQRSSGRASVRRDYQSGETEFLWPTTGDPLIHDLENVGTTRLRFVTVELLS